MRLRTIQEEFRRAQEEDGVLRADGRRLSLGRGFRRRYRWLRGRMRERVPVYGGRPPIWCRREKPDVRGTGDGARVVRATLEIPSERVPVSDFGLWRVPLNARAGFLAQWSS